MRMIPSYVNPGTPSAAERRLFALFERSALPDTYACLHSVNLPLHLWQRMGEADFIVVGPYGIYVLEVKGGRISYQAGQWHFQDRHDQSHERHVGPFD